MAKQCSKLCSTIVSKLTCQRPSLSLTTKALGTRGPVRADQGTKKQKNSFFVFHVDAWAESANACAWRDKSTRSHIYSLRGNSTYAQSIRQWQKNSLSFRWCHGVELNKRRKKEIEGGRRWLMSLAAQRQLVANG